MTPADSLSIILACGIFVATSHLNRLLELNKRYHDFIRTLRAPSVHINRSSVVLRVIGGILSRLDGFLQLLAPGIPVSGALRRRGRALLLRDMRAQVLLHIRGGAPRPEHLRYWLRIGEHGWHEKDGRKRWVFIYTCLIQHVVNTLKQSPTHVAYCITGIRLQ